MTNFWYWITIKQIALIVFISFLIHHHVLYMIDYSSYEWSFTQSKNIITIWLLHWFITLHIFAMFLKCDIAHWNLYFDWLSILIKNLLNFGQLSWVSLTDKLFTVILNFYSNECFVLVWSQQRLWWLSQSTYKESIKIRCDCGLWDP